MKKRILIGILVLLLSVSLVSAGNYYVYDIYGWITGKAVENKTIESGVAYSSEGNSKTINGIEISVISTSYSKDKISSSVELLINGQKYKLGIDGWIEVDGKIVKLENVGSAGAVLVSVDGVMDTISSYLIGEPIEAPIVLNESSIVGGISVEELCPAPIQPYQLWSKLNVGSCSIFSGSNVCLVAIEGYPEVAVLQVDRWEDKIKNGEKRRISNIGMIAYLPTNETKPWNYITLTTWPCFGQIQSNNLTLVDLRKEVPGQLVPVDLRKEVPDQLISKEAKEICNGCFVNEKCLPYGTRMEGKYCDIKSSNLVFQVGLDDECENSYECKSNECSNGKCISTAGLLQRLLDALSKLFGK